MNIAMIGATGKVGRIALQNFYMNNNVEDLNLTLIGPRPNKDKGLLLDIENTLPLKTAVEFLQHVPIHATTTDQFSALENANLIIVTASLWASKEQREEFEKFDTTGRMVQSFVNYGLISDISKQIAAYAPNAHVVIVTNQSDMMAEIAREHLPPQNVLGLGGIVDSSRFRMSLSQSLHLEYAKAKGHIIGYHNNEMIALSSSLSSPAIDIGLLENLVQTARQSGGAIALLQRDPRSSSMATGASILPGYALYQTMAAYSGQIPSIEEAFNVVLTDIASANKYGVPQGTALSVPVVISKGQYEISSRYAPTPDEKNHLAAAQQRFTTDYEGFVSHMKRPAFMQQANLPVHRPI